MSNIQERYKPTAMAANTSYQFPEGTPISLGGFIAVTAGTLTVTSANGTVLLNALPVTAGVYYPLVMYTGHRATVALAGGASGTLLVGS